MTYIENGETEPQVEVGLLQDFREYYIKMP